MSVPDSCKTYCSRKCSVKEVSLKVLRKLQENICGGVSFLMRCRLQAYN